MRIRSAIVGCVLLALGSADAHAQAFVDEPNSLSASFGYTFNPSGKVVSTAGEGQTELPGIVIFGHIFEIGAEYVTPIEGLQVEARLPIVGTKLGEGSFEHAPVPGPYDDGDLHFTVTDFRGGLRYQIKAIEQYLGLAFAVATSIPTHDYPTYGFTIPGVHLKALHLGVAVARTLDPIAPNLFFQIEYEYTIREHVKVDGCPGCDPDELDATEEFGRNYSEGNVAIGYFLPADFTVALAAMGRVSHGGMVFDTITDQPYPVQYYHDRLLYEKFIVGGGDIGYDVNDRLSLGLSARFFLYGSNTRNMNMYGIQAAYKFL